MLTSDLVLARRYKGEIRPRYIDCDDPQHLALARDLIAIFTAHQGQPRHLLDLELRERLGTGTSFLLHRGLTKLLLDRCEFATEASLDPEKLRRAAFEAAAATYQAAPQTAGQPFHFDRAAVLAEAAASLQLTAADVEAGLYADLKDEQILSSFKPWRSKPLLQRYNVALAQGVLFRAVELEIKIDEENPLRHRELFRRIKFFQLLHRVEGRASTGYTIHLDGPLSLFQSSQKYGLQMASFLPTLLHFDRWTLNAELLWGKRRLPSRFELSPSTGLVSHTKLLGQWQPEELSFLPEQLAKLGSAWSVSTDAELIDLGGEGVLVPDFVLTHEDGRRVFMEVLGFWRKGAVASRLALLRRHGPPNLILALSKQLATEREGLDELPGEVYVFRRQPVARQVLAVLERVREGGTDR